MLAFKNSSENGEEILCADCSSHDVQWASLNRGVMLCDDCCSVHRNLGRHLSNIRSLRYGRWEGKQLELVEHLYRNGANRVWEHELINASASKGKRKPSPNDPIVPLKEDFIHLKYQDEGFTKKCTNENDITDLNKQLLACVRTAHVETTLRLIANGADPLYCEPDTRNSCLHIAAREGQILQIELLFLYGADPHTINLEGHTAKDLASMKGFSQVTSRLEDFCHYITDRFTIFLTGRKVNREVQSFLIPEMLNTSQYNESLSVLRYRIQNSSHDQFMKLMQDIYDEIDRREVQNDWIRTQSDRGILKDIYASPFLPLIPQYSAMRNQCRQKLAKLDAQQLTILITDVLTDCERRVTNSKSLFHLIPPKDTSYRDDYAKISDEVEYDVVHGSTATMSDDKRSSCKSNRGMPLGENTIAARIKSPSMTADDHAKLREENMHLSARFELLSSECGYLKRELANVRKEMLSAVNGLKHENQRLQEQILLPRSKETNAYFDMTKEAHKPPIPKNLKSSQSISSSFSGPHEYKDGGSMQRSASSTPLTSENWKKNALISEVDNGRDNEIRSKQSQNALTQSVRSDTLTYPDFPDNLIRTTEKLTVQIRKLVKESQVCLIPRVAGQYSDTIGELVSEIIDYIPPESKTVQVKDAIEAMWDSLAKLCCKCNSPNLNSKDTCNAAYLLAQATKNLLVLFTN